MDKTFIHRIPNLLRCAEINKDIPSLSFAVVEKLQQIYVNWSSSKFPIYTPAHHLHTKSTTLHATPAGINEDIPQTIPHTFQYTMEGEYTIRPPKSYHKEESNLHSNVATL